MAIIGLDPTSGPIGGGDDSRRLAPRPRTLSGQTIGLVANGLGRLSASFREWTIKVAYGCILQT